MVYFKILLTWNSFSPIYAALRNLVFEVPIICTRVCVFFTWISLSTDIIIILLNILFVPWFPIWFCASRVFRFSVVFNIFLSSFFFSDFWVIRFFTWVATCQSIRPVWSESSLSAWRKLGSLATHWAHSEDSDQTGRMPRPIWVFAGRTLIVLVLSCRGSLVFSLPEPLFLLRHFDKIWRIYIETSSFSNQFWRKNQVEVWHGISVLNVVLQNKWIQ